eukprot:11182102-Lingulodinium_polyedra.AAC.1
MHAQGYRVTPHGGMVSGPNITATTPAPEGANARANPALPTSSDYTPNASRALKNQLADTNATP